jgi:hypothetical protein
MARKEDVNKLYVASVLTMTFVLPLAGWAAQAFFADAAFSFRLFCAWFIFFAVGLRLFLAGIRQTTKPEFTAKEIFRIDNPESFPIVRELGFANLCFGLIGLLSLFLPSWRIVSAFGSGLYYGIAGVQHLVKKPAGANERFALATDLIIFILLAFCFATLL